MFSPKKFIAAKRDGKDHSEEELKQWLAKYLQGETPDYQMTAWLMAVYFRGMSQTELTLWTRLMTSSGEKFSRASGDGYFIDKHSTGGVGDKTSLILVPLVAAVSQRLWGKKKVRIPMMSGRGLGHSGGTLDKLDTIPGFRSRLNRKEAEAIFEKNDFVMMGQTEDLAPADRRIYSLRDVTATVESLPLIISSILSKKLSESLNGLVLDVKFGRGAFMTSLEKARELALGLTKVAKQNGVNTIAWLTNMDEPLGWAVGNALEVDECEQFLAGTQRDRGLEEVCVVLAATMLELASDGAATFAEMKSHVEHELSEKKALMFFYQMVEAQGGNWLEFDKQRQVFRREYQTLVVHAKQSGYLGGLDARVVGEISVAIGAGRENRGAEIDPWAGFIFHKKIGDRVQANEPIIEVFLRRKTDETAVISELEKSIQINQQETGSTKWCLERIEP